MTDAEEGLILVNIDTMADGELRNNKLRRAVTWNEGGVLDGARHIVLAGEVAYIPPARRPRGGRPRRPAPPAFGRGARTARRAGERGAVPLLVGHRRRRA
jgi:hypothetical protein